MNKQAFLLMLCITLFCGINLNAQTSPGEDIASVVGTGTYCGSGAVGLSTSVLGVTYTLVKNGTPTATTVSGTGAAVTFGLQTAGTYTATGSDAITIPGSAIVTINAPTLITGQSTAGQTNCLNVSYTPINVTATGTGTLIYQWYSNTSANNTSGTSLLAANGAQTNTYTPQASVAGTLYYYCIVTGDCGSVTSAVSGAFLTNPVTAISAQSTDAQTQAQGGTFSAISVTATGVGLTYQWYSSATPSNTGGSSITDATANTFTPLATTVGTTYYYCVVTGTCASATSAVSGAMVVNPNVKQLSLKVFLQGFYNVTNSNMNKCKDYVAAVTVDKYSGTIVDLITVELRNATTYATVEYTASSVELHQDGSCNSAGLAYIEIPATYTGSYYITVKTRNHLATTTTSAVSFATNILSFDFTDAATKAYGSNMALLATGKYGMFVGDVNGDGLVNNTDFSFVNTNLLNAVVGYSSYDVNGDGYVNNTDFSIVNTSLLNGVSKLNP